MTAPHATTVLPNGLAVLAERVSGPGFAVELRLPVGAAHDPAGREGSASLLEEWVHKGTTTLDARGLADALDDLGVRRGGSVSHETTRFTLSGLRADLPRALALLADVVRRPALDPDELPTLVDLARQDLESLQDSPSDRLGVDLRRAAFHAPYAHPVGGTLEALDVIGPDDVRALHALYTPRGAALALVADAEPDELVALARETFGDWSGEPAGLPSAVFRGAALHHVPDSSQQTQLGLLMDARTAPNQRSWLLTNLAVNVLSGGTASRLWEEVRERRGLVYGVGATTFLAGGAGFVWASASSTPDRAQETLDVILAEFDRLARGVTDAEFERARTGMLVSTVFGAESARGRAAHLARDWLVLGRRREVNDLRADIQGVEREELDAFVASRPLSEPVVVTLGPTALKVENRVQV